MRKFKSKKYVLLIIILAVVLGVTFMIFINKLCINQSNENHESNLVSSQRTQIISFYQEHKDTLNKIKDGLWEYENSISEISEDGYIKLSDGSQVWLSDISPDIKQTFTDGEKYNVRGMYLEDPPEKEFRIEAFFAENNVEIDVVYSTSDPSANSSMYSPIEDGWYLFVAGMT